MALDKRSGRKQKEDSEDLSKLTRQQLRDLEAREKTTGQKVLDSIIVVLPVVCGMIAILEYMLIPNGNQNQDIYTYLGLLIILIVAYIVYMTVGGISSEGIKTYWRSAGIERRFFQRCFYCWQDMTI